MTLLSNNHRTIWSLQDLAMSSCHTEAKNTCQPSFCQRWAATSTINSSFFQFPRDGGMIPEANCGLLHDYRTMFIPKKTCINVTVDLRYSTSWKHIFRNWMMKPNLFHSKQHIPTTLFQNLLRINIINIINITYHSCHIHLYAAEVDLDA